jgi:hypothetical protein
MIRIRRRERPDGKRESFLSGISKGVRNGILAAIVGLALAMLTAVFTPIGDFILDLLPDRGNLTFVDKPDKAYVGVEFTVDPYITPVGKLRHAILEVVPVSPSLEYLSAQSRYRIGKVAEAAHFSTLYKNTTLRFVSHDAGTALINCQLFSEQKVIDQPPPISIRVFRHYDYDGDWDLTIGETHGTMHVEATRSDTASVYGVYTLQTGIKGLISGTFDGSTFAGFMTVGDSASRFEFNGKTKGSHETIAVTGTATLKVAANGGWQPAEGQPPFNLVMTKKKA